MASPASIATRSSETAAAVPHYDLFIGGEWVRSTRNAPVEDYNPATGALYARIEQAGEEEARNAIAAAAKSGEAGATPWSRSASPC